MTKPHIETTANILSSMAGDIFLIKIKKKTSSFDEVM